MTEKVASRAVEHIDHAALRVAADVGIHGLAQGSRDYLMTTLDPALRNWLLDEDNDVSLISEDGTYAFFTGFLTAGTMRLPGAIRTEWNRPGTALAVRKFGTDMPNYLTEDGTDYFEGVEDEAGARARYRELARKNHPDVGGSEAVMKEINRQYEMRINYYKGQAAGAQAAAAWKDPARSGAQGPITQPNAGDSASGTGLMLPGGSLPTQSSMGVPGPILLGPGVTTAPNGPVLDPKTSPVAMLPEAGTDGANVRLTQEDAAEYMETGTKGSIISAKKAEVERGGSAILTTAQETHEFITDAIRGVAGQVTKAYGKIGARMAGDIRAESEEKIDLTGWYLELVPDDLHHSYRQHLNAKRQGNIDLTEQDYLNIPDYIDGYDDILAVNTFKQGDREVVLGKKINGYSVIMALISNKRKSLHFKNMWGLDTPTYEKRYGKGRGSTASHPGRSSVSANDPPKMIHGASSGLSISQPIQVVNPRLALPGGIPADIPPGLRKLYLLAQEMSASPPPREIPQRPVQQSPQEILSQLAREMARDSLQGGALDSLSNEDIRAMLEEIARRQSGETALGEADISGEIERESDIGDAARLAAKSVLRFKKVTGFSGLPHEMRSAFRLGLSGANLDVQKALKKIYLKADYAVINGKRSRYSMSRLRGKAILISKYAPPSTLAHELFHKLDLDHMVSMSLGESLMQDYTALNLKSNFDIVAYLLQEFPEAFAEAELYNEHRFGQPYRGISDMIHGLTDGQVDLGFGHPKEYWKQPGTLEAEAWAQFGRILFDNQGDVIKMFQNLFPNFYKSAMMALKELN